MASALALYWGCFLDECSVSGDADADTGTGTGQVGYVPLTAVIFFSVK